MSKLSRIERRAEGGIADARRRWKAAAGEPDLLVEDEKVSRQRGYRSIPFLLADASPIWKHYPRLADVAVKAELSEREAEVMLRWRALEMTPNGIAAVMKMKRQHFWRYRRRINEKLEAAYPDLSYEVAIVQAIAADERHDVIQCQKNSQGGSGRTPIYYENASGLVRMWTPPTITLPQDLRAPYVQAIDVV